MKSGVNPGGLPSPLRALFTDRQDPHLHNPIIATSLEGRRRSATSLTVASLSDGMPDEVDEAVGPRAQCGRCPEPVGGFVGRQHRRRRQRWERLAWCAKGLTHHVVGLVVPENLIQPVSMGLRVRTALWRAGESRETNDPILV